MSRSVYTFLLWLLLPLVPLKLLWRAIRQPDYLHHWGERFGFYPSPLTPHPSPTIWLHCVSVGETRAAMPLIALLRTRYPQHRILITHGTPTGRAASAQLLGDQVMRAYLPYDLPFAVQRFLDHFQPQFGLLLETELWFNLIAQCKARDIPLLLVNARLSARSARGYARLGSLSRQALQDLRAIAAQTDADAERLRGLGATAVSVTGNLKFDATLPDARDLGLRQLFGTARPVFLAASTRDGEEALILDALQSVGIPDLLTIIVPRHPQRFDQVASLLEKHGISFVRRSSLSPGEDRETDEVIASVVNPQVILGDSMGELAAYYTACDVALVGGSLLPYGGQNLIEACALGKPVLIGPHTYNFEDVAAQAVQCGAARRVRDASEMALVLERLLLDAATLKQMGDAGIRFCEGNRGSVEQVMALLEKFSAPAC